MGAGLKKIGNARKESWGEKSYPFLQRIRLLMSMTNGMVGSFFDRNKFKNAMEVVLKPLNVTVRAFKFTFLFCGSLSAIGIHLPRTGALANTHAGQIPSFTNVKASLLLQSGAPLTAKTSWHCMIPTHHPPMANKLVSYH